MPIRVSSGHRRQNMHLRKGHVGDYMSFLRERTGPGTATVPKLRGPWAYNRTLTGLDLDMKNRLALNPQN